MVEELLEAAKTGDLVRVKYLIRDVGLPVDSRNPPDGPTALYWAACNGYVKVCSWLIGHRANPNVTLPKSGSTPLHAAADRGHHDCVLLLICSGASINQQTTNNRDTSLHLAAYRGLSSICNLLIDHGADIFILNKQCRSALDEAYVTGNVDIVQMICKKHAELANAQKLTSKMSKRFEEGLYFSDPLKDQRTKESSSSHYYGVDNDDRIGIQQFDKRKCSAKDEAQSSQHKITSPTSSFGSSERHEISKTFASFHSSLMEQLERLTTSLEEKDRQLIQLKKENEKLKTELKKFAHFSP